MKFAVESLSILVDQLKCVATISVHVAETIRRATVSEHKSQLMGGLRSQGKEVPVHIRVLVRGRTYHMVDQEQCYWDLLI